MDFELPSKLVYVGAQGAFRKVLGQPANMEILKQYYTADPLGNDGFECIFLSIPFKLRNKDPERALITKKVDRKTPILTVFLTLSIKYAC